MSRRATSIYPIVNIEKAAGRTLKTDILSNESIKHATNSVYHDDTTKGLTKAPSDRTDKVSED